VQPFPGGCLVNGDWLLTFGCFGAALVISFFTSMTGISGAFALVPFQISVLGIVGPVVSSTNHLYNLIATPGGIFRYMREGRFCWPLLAVLASGTVPGAVLGAWIRIRFLPDAAKFRMFAGLILLVMGVRLLTGLNRSGKSVPRASGLEGRERDPLESSLPGGVRATTRSWMLVPVSFVVGIVGGAYGIGGAVMIAPFLIGVLGLSFGQIAGALLAATFLTSLSSISAYQVLAHLNPAARSAPDWALGFTFGLGGLVGTYTGSRFQKKFSPFALRLILAGSILLVALRYLWPW
jgi:uncharacterized membrane protein YfcA